MNYPKRLGLTINRPTMNIYELTRQEQQKRDEIRNKTKILQVEILKKPKNFSEKLEFRVKTDLFGGERLYITLLDVDSIFSNTPDGKTDTSIKYMELTVDQAVKGFTINLTEKEQEKAFRDVENDTAELYLRIYNDKTGHAYSEVFDVGKFDFKRNKVFKQSDVKCFCNRDFTVEEFKKIILNLRKTTFYNDQTIEYYHQDKLFYLEPLLNDKEKNDFQIFTWVINQMFYKYKINTCIRKINFLAQMYPETKYFTDLSENNPAANLGKYYGRGFIQLTHHGKEDIRTKNADSYLGYKKISNLDVIEDPDLICKSLNIASDSGGWFWRYGKLLSDGFLKDLNTLADKDDVNEISRLVNGGENARKERLEAHKQLKKIFKYEACINKK